MRKFRYILLFFVFCNFQSNDSYLDTLIRKSIKTNDWHLLNKFIGEEVKCEICIDKNIYKSVLHLPNRIDTVHNHLALFKKDMILKKELPELFADTDKFKINLLRDSRRSGVVYEEKDEFEIHVPMQDGTQIDLHFKNIENKSKLTAIYATP